MIELCYLKVVHRDHGISECKIVIDQSAPTPRLKMINRANEEYSLEDIIESREWTRFTDKSGNKIYYGDRLYSAKQKYRVIRYENAESHYYQFPWVEHIYYPNDNQLLSHEFCSNAYICVGIP